MAAIIFWSKAEFWNTGWNIIFWVIYGCRYTINQVLILGASKFFDWILFGCSPKICMQPPWIWKKIFFKYCISIISIFIWICVFAVWKTKNIIQIIRLFFFNWLQFYFGWLRIRRNQPIIHNFGQNLSAL